MFSELFENYEVLSGNLSRKKILMVKNRKIEDVVRIFQNKIDFGVFIDSIYYNII